MSVSFTKACLDYFGRKPNQTAMDFGAELKALTQMDRSYFIREFAKVGITIDLPLAS